MTIQTARTGPPDRLAEAARAGLADEVTVRPELADRAAAHCAQKLTRRGQHFQYGVSTLESTVVMLALEAGYPFHRGACAWRCAVRLPLTAPRLLATIGELTRTGLIRDYRDPATGVHTLIPAHIHLAVHGASACRFVGEDLGPMRARLSEDVALVDCRDCLAAVA